jgi:ferrochelatase
MAYGTPEHLEDVGAYFADIRGGRTPSADAVANLRARYEAVGGGTPLLAITHDVRDRLEAALADAGTPRRVYIGMRHWHPYIADTVRRMAEDGVRRLTAIVLAPHYSRMSVGAYRARLDEAHAALGAPFDIRFIERWGMQPRFLAMMTELVARGLAQFPPERRAGVTVVFSAHSLPVRIREWKDPYEAELLASARAVAQTLGLAHWRFAWQSAGGTGEPWIGPDILDFLQELHGEGVRDVLQVPIGFVADHLEVLYDIDIEAAARARELGMTLHRTELPNARPEFIAVLADLVRG